MHHCHAVQARPDGYGSCVQHLGLYHYRGHVAHGVTVHGKMFQIQWVSHLHGKHIVVLELIPIIDHCHFSLGPFLEKRESKVL